MKMNGFRVYNVVSQLDSAQKAMMLDLIQTTQESVVAKTINDAKNTGTTDQEDVTFIRALEITRQALVEAREFDEAAPESPHSRNVDSDWGAPDGERPAREHVNDFNTGRERPAILDAK